MLSSPFSFFRGAALVMASDLAGTPVSGLTVQACGDAHLSNFGVFATPERHLVFDVNDFDETLPGPWEWDLKRLTASLVVAGRERGFSTKERRAVVLGTAEQYRQSMLQFAIMGSRDVWYAHLDVDKLMAEMGSQLEDVSRRRTERALAKARTKDSHTALGKLTRLVDGRLQIVSDPPLIVPIEELFGFDDQALVLAGLRQLLSSYRRTLPHDRRYLIDQFDVVHIARKVVGVGSVGTRAWVVLLIGRDENDPLFLQAKEAQASVLERFTRRSAHRNQGERVVAGQRLMQASSDVFLGWERLTAPDGSTLDFYVRQLQDWKGSADVTLMIPSGMAGYGRLCAWTLARAHARSGDRIAIAAYMGKSRVFAEAIASFSESYADVNERDYQALGQAVAAGRLQALTGV